MQFMGRPISVAARAKVMEWFAPEMQNLTLAASIVDNVADLLEKDNPNLAQRVGLSHLRQDVTLYYRLVASILAQVSLESQVAGKNEALNIHGEKVTWFRCGACGHEWANMTIGVCANCDALVAS